MMRVFFCLIPAVWAWLLFWVLATALGGAPMDAALCGLIFFVAAFGLGVQVTQPHPQRGEMTATRRAAAQKGGA